VDIIATIPIDRIIEDSINLSFVKGLKIIKFVKLIKILKITKLLSLRNKQIKSVIGNEFISYLRKSSGFFDLMRQNL